MGERLEKGGRKVGERWEKGCTIAIVYNSYLRFVQYHIFIFAMTRACGPTPCYTVAKPSTVNIGTGSVGT